MSDLVSTWFAVVPGEIGETLVPSGLLVTETHTDENTAIAEARVNSAMSGKPYRVISMRECAYIKAPHMERIPGEGQNPMSAEDMAEAKREIAERKKR